jgi:hypothetical protein
MAYNFQDDLDERLKEVANQSASAIIQPGQVQATPQNQQSNLPNNMPQLSSGTGLIGGSNVSNDAARGTTQGPGGNRFANIGQYIQQNDPSQLSEAVGSRIEGAGERARQGINQVQEQFRQQVQAQTVNFDDRLANLIRQNPTQLTDAERQQVQAQRTAQFQGPQNISDIESFRPVQSQIENTRNLAQSTQSEEGRAQLAREVTTGRRATSGVVNLNNLLLSVDPRAQQRLAQATENVSDLDQRLEAARAAAQEQARTAAETTAQARQQTQSLLDTEKTGLQQNLQQKAESERERLVKLENELRQVIGQLSAAPTPAGVQTKITPDINYATAPGAFGGNYDQFVSLVDTVNKARDLGLNRDLNPFIRSLASPEAVTAQQVATADDLARYQALSQLAGVQPQFLTQVGQAPTRLAEFNYADALADLNAAISAEEARRKAPAPRGDSRDTNDLNNVIRATLEPTRAVLEPAKEFFSNVFSDKNTKKDIEKFDSKQVFSSILK